MPERDAQGRFARGQSGNPNGRPAGSGNKGTAEVREMVRQALELEGGVEYLRRCARTQPMGFMSLCARLPEGHS